MMKFYRLCLTSTAHKLLSSLTKSVFVSGSPRLLTAFWRLDAITQAVTDTDSFRNLLNLFLCERLGPETVPAAIQGQRRILQMLIDTLTSKYSATPSFSHRILYLANKANLVVSDPIGLQIMKNIGNLPANLAKLSQHILEKATRAATLEYLTLDWLLSLVGSQESDLIQTALSVWMAHSDVAMTNKQDSSRLNWILKTKREHLLVLEQCCDVNKQLQLPNECRQMARQTMVNLYGSSS